MNSIFTIALLALLPVVLFFVVIGLRMPIYFKICRFETYIATNHKRIYRNNIYQKIYGPVSDRVTGFLLYNGIVDGIGSVLNWTRYDMRVWLKFGTRNLITACKHYFVCRLYSLSRKILGRLWDLYYLDNNIISGVAVNLASKFQKINYKIWLMREDTWRPDTCYRC